MVVTDLDGTLLDDAQQVSEMDWRTLERLERSGIVRVIATGRNYFSAKKVLTPNFPIDYLIFASGAGLIHWAEKELLFRHEIPAEQVIEISNYLIRNNIDFMIHKPLPDSHHFLYHYSGAHNPDFTQRVELYSEYAAPLNSHLAKFGPASQFITIIPKEIHLLDQMKKDLVDFKVIRATSPLDRKTMWVEIFPATVSKARAAQWLCRRLQIRKNHVLAVGNDYNDLDLLCWAEHSYLVANAPDDIKDRFKLTASNGESGFSRVVLDNGILDVAIANS